MGFQVQIAEGDEAVLKKLKSNPNSIFTKPEKPYLGFLVFLVGGEHKNEQMWLKENIIPLDSTTGESVAFFIFARRFDFTLQIDSPFREEIRSKKTFQLDTELVAGQDSYSVSRMVKNGACGHVLDGDAISAIGYAADEVAREFGILDEMPCVLVMDVFQRQSPLVYSLNAESADQFNSSLREALSVFEKQSGYPVLKSIVQQIIKADSTQIELEMNQLTRDLELLDGVPAIEAARKHYSKLTGTLNDLLQNGQLRQCRHTCDEFAKESESDITAFDPFLQTVSEETNNLLAILRTTGSIEHFCDQRTWPLNNKDRQHISTVCEKYFSRLFPNTDYNKAILSRDSLMALLPALHAKRQSMAEKLLSSLPSFDSVSETIAQKYNERRESISSQTELLISKLNQNTKTKNEALKLLVDSNLDLPSLVTCFQKQTNRAKRIALSKTLYNKFQCWCSKWSDPESMMKLFALSQVGK